MKILVCHNQYRMRAGEDLAFDFTRLLLEGSGHELVFYTQDNRMVGDYGFCDMLLFPGRVTANAHSFSGGNSLETV